jgi:hypothetical protein
VADSPKVGLHSTGCIRAVHPDHGQRGDVYARGATAGVGGGSAAGWAWRTHDGGHIVLDLKGGASCSWSTR